MKTKFIIITILIAIIFTSCNQTKKETSVVEKSATIFYNGDIITMESDEPTYAEAIVEENGIIVFVGNKDEALGNYNKANLVDLQGKTMLPAFLDGHGHFYNVGFTAMCANILPPPDGPGVDFNSVVETLNKYKETEKGKYVLEKLGWIIGNGYDDSQLAEKDHLQASDLDKVSTDVPVVIIHQSGHLASINTKGLELMGYTADTPNPDGGVIRKDSNGNPNGVLEEAAFFNIIFPVLGKIDDEMAAKCIKQGQDEYAKKGYLTAQDGRTTIDQLAALRKAADEQAYYIDVVAYPDMTLGTEEVAEGTYTPTHQYKNKFRLGGVKLTLDGSPQGKTAWLTKCYHVNPEGRTGCYEGYPIMDDDKATEYVKTAFKNKWQILCHSNGDAAIDQYIKAVGAAEKEFGYLNHRTVLIHGQTLRKDQIPELVELSILPSLFPMHTFYWGDWHKESVLGEPRAGYISPCRDVIDAGLTITSHHDAPVTFPNSMRVLDATINRVTRSGKILGPDQKITPYEGLKTLTDWAAYQYFEEDRKGTLSKGKLADFVILDKNPLKIDPMQIHDIQILKSIKEGKTVYELI
jgi:predicted amidohydrolase YtcJ